MKNKRKKNKKHSGNGNTGNKAVTQNNLTSSKTDEYESDEKIISDVPADIPAEQSEPVSELPDEKLITEILSEVQSLPAEAETVSEEIQSVPETKISSMDDTLPAVSEETETADSGSGNTADNNDEISESDSVSGKKQNLKKIIPAAAVSISFIAIVVYILLSGNTKNHYNVLPEVTESPGITSVTAETDAPPETEVSEYVITPAEINPSEYEHIIEAESVSEKPDSLNVSDARAGFSGEGYLSGFSGDESQNLKFDFEVPVSQHYDISVCFAGDEAVKNQIYMNGEPLFYIESTSESAGRFAIKTYYGVFIEKGNVSFSINQIDGNFDLDYIKVKNNQSIYAAKTDIEPSLINENASENARELMKYLADNFGQKIITGQYVSDSSDTEIEKIFEHTGKYPAIRFGDLRLYSGNLPESEKDKSPDEIEAAVKWAENGGITGYVWHWYAPMNSPQIYSKDADFNLEYAVTVNDVAMMNDEDLEHYRSVGAITNECFNIIRDIDRVSAELKKLCDKDIPVLWRPLHEASGDWFWWGNSGPEPYKWLWSVMYRRMTEYHRLNNLIWVWSAQGSDYFVGNDMFDIAAVDLYDSNTDNTSYYKQYQWLYSLTGGQKLIALSECGTLPDMELTFRDRAVWSYFGLWYGDYILDKNGELSEKYNTRKSFMIMYNSDRSVTLEKYIRRNEIKPAVTEPAESSVASESETEPEPAEENPLSDTSE